MSIMHKKGALALGIVAVLLALIILAGYLMNVSMRNCNSNNECPANAYCGSDYECHEFPEQIVVKENNFLPASIVLGMSFIIGVIILKMGKIPFSKN